MEQDDLPIPKAVLLKHAARFRAIEGTPLGFASDVFYRAASALIADVLTALAKDE